MNCVCKYRVVYLDSPMILTVNAADPTSTTVTSFLNKEVGEVKLVDNLISRSIFIPTLSQHGEVYSRGSLYFC